MASFADNGIDLKIFLNEEIKRLKTELEKATDVAEIKADPDMVKKTNRIVNKLTGFATQTITEELLLTVLHTQALVKEIYTDGNNN